MAKTTKTTEAKAAIEAADVSTLKAAAEKAKATKPKAKAKATKAKATKAKAKVTKKALDTKNVKDTAKSARVLKYKYPKDVTDQMEKKSWRRTTRAKLNSLQKAIDKAEDKKSKATAEKELKAYQELVLN